MRKWLLLVTAVLALEAAALAQVSLWSGSGAAGKRAVNLGHTVASRSFKLHDIIYIIVSVSASATTDEQSDVERKNRETLIIQQYLRLKQDGLGFDLKGETPEKLGLNMRGDKTNEGDGQSDRADTLRTRLAAEVVDIKPNGNLVLEARHTFTKQREKTTITLSGVARPLDVTPDNVIYSYNIADADIRYESSGPVTDANRRGWLGKVLDKVWPF